MAEKRKRTNDSDEESRYNLTLTKQQTNTHEKFYTSSSSEEVIFVDHYEDEDASSSGSFRNLSFESRMGAPHIGRESEENREEQDSQNEEDEEDEGISAKKTYKVNLSKV